MKELLVERPLFGHALALCGAQEAARLAERDLAAWLTPAETAQWRNLASEKRRQDWLCGRVAAKKVLGAALEFELLNDADGRPYARRRDGRPAPPLSISHCAEGGACALSANELPVGVDYEVVAPRAERVLELYLHADERPLAATALAQTALWSLKEAVLKLLGLGLAGGLTDVRFSSIEGISRPGLFGAALKRWEELGRPDVTAAWRPEGEAVLALSWCAQGGA